MPRLLLIGDPDHDGGSPIALDELVLPGHLEDEHCALQIIERLRWAVDDCAKLPARPPLSSRGSEPRPPLAVPAAAAGVSLLAADSSARPDA